MTFTKFVQIGRIAYIAFGPDQGKLVTIVDLIDQNRALVDGPTTGVRRQAINIKSLYLTKFLIKIPHSAREGTLRKAWTKAEIDKKWQATNWSKRLAAEKIRTNLTDFDRFKLMKTKQARNRLVSLAYGKLKLAAKKTRKETKKDGKKPAAKPAAAKPAAGKPAAKK